MNNTWKFGLTKKQWLIWAVVTFIAWLAGDALVLNVCTWHMLPFLAGLCGSQIAWVAFIGALMNSALTFCLAGLVVLVAMVLLARFFIPLWILIFNIPNIRKDVGMFEDDDV